MAVCLVTAAILAGCGAAPPTPRPTPVPPTATPVVKRAAEAVAAIKTVCLAMNLNFDRGTPSNFTNDRELVQRVLTGIGLTVMTSGDCDASLSIDVVMTPVSANYSVASGGSKACFSGASLAGAMTLSKPGYEPTRIVIDDRIAPPSGVIGYCASEAYAPFDGAWVKAVLKGLNRIWGAPAVIQAAQDNGSHHPGGCNPEAITFGADILVGDKKGNDMARALSYMVNDGAKYYCWRNVLTAMQRTAGSINRDEKNAAVAALTRAFAARSKDIADAELLCKTLTSVTGANLKTLNLSCAAPSDAAKWDAWWATVP